MDGDGPKWNHYTCDTCRQVTVTVHEDPGTTPMFLNCRATPRCQGSAVSAMYRGRQDDSQRAHLVWFRPKTERDAKAAIKAYPRRFRADMLDHWQLGGCLSKNGPAALKSNPAVYA